MKKDLHDIDDLFRSTLGAYKEMPSAGVKESLDAALDKSDAELYKRRLIWWKRTALLLLLILTGLVLYEFVILKQRSPRSGERMAEKAPSLSDENNKEIHQHPVTDNTINDYNGTDKKEATKNNTIDSTKTEDDTDGILPRLKEFAVPVTTHDNRPTIFDKDWSAKKIGLQKSDFKKGKSISLIEAEHKKTPGIPSFPGKKINRSPETNNPLPIEIELLASRIKIGIPQTVDGRSNSIKQLNAINDSLLKNTLALNSKKQKRSFKPIWMISAFASYERAGYRLKSDFPTNITTIKHSEVHEPSFSMGVLVTRQWSKQWGLQTGFIYSQTEIGITPQKLYALQGRGGDISFKYITSSGYAYIKPGLGAPPSIGDSLLTTEGKHRLKIISIPLTVKYAYEKNKLTFTPGVGIEADFLISAKVETEIERPSNPEIVFINKLNGAKPFYLSAVADAEFRYKINNKLSVSFRPAIRLAITPITKNNVVKTFPRSVGFGIGVTRNF